MIVIWALSKVVCTFARLYFNVWILMFENFTKSGWLVVLIDVSFTMKYCGINCNWILLIGKQAYTFLINNDVSAAIYHV